MQTIKIEKISQSAYLPIDYKSISSMKSSNPVFAYTLKISSNEKASRYKIQANSFMNEVFIPEGTTYSFLLGPHPKTIEIPYLNAGTKLAILAMFQGNQ